MTNPLRRNLTRLAFALALLAASFAFLGSRGLAEADEGRYVNAALYMIDSGDWLTPRLHGMIYLDKPPMVDWSVAVGILLLGRNPWGARFGHALALVATALLVYAWTRREWGERMGFLAGAAYATTLLPAIGGRVVTPDGLLVLWTTLASVAYWGWRQASMSSAARWCWALVLGFSAGMGLLTKGTATLVFLAPIVLHAFWEERLALFARIELWGASLMALGLGGSWYFAVAHQLPSAADYFFHNQVAGRLWEDSYQRNPDWWSAFEVYGVALIVGLLPWGLAWLSLLRSSERSAHLRTLAGDPLVRFLVLGTVLPVAVFALASSKLPLYVLPVFPALVMVTVFVATQVETRLVWGTRLLISAGLLLALLIASTVVPLDRDTGVLAAALDRAGVEPATCLDVVETKVHGLGLYGYERVYWNGLWPETYPYFEAPTTLDESLPGLVEQCGGQLGLLVRPRHREGAEAVAALSGLGCSAHVLTERFHLLQCNTGSVQGKQPQGDKAEQYRNGVQR